MFLYIILNIHWENYIPVWRKYSGKEDFELILVDDGSKDRSYEIMTELREKDHRVRIIQMARNFGQHPALLCGFAHVKGEFVVTMDDDLQHQPEELPKMVRTMQERPDVDVSLQAMKEESMVRYANWERNFLYGQLQRCWEKIRIFRSPVTG